jgi:hypothetical protein
MPLVLYKSSGRFSIYSKLIVQICGKMLRNVIVFHFFCRVLSQLSLQQNLTDKKLCKNMNKFAGQQLFIFIAANTF